MDAESWIRVPMLPDDLLDQAIRRQLRVFDIHALQLANIESSGRGWMLVNAERSGQLEPWCLIIRTSERENIMELGLAPECEQPYHWDIPSQWLDALGDIDALYGQDTHAARRAHQWRTLAAANIMLA